MTSVADLIVSQIYTVWDPAVAPKPKIMKLIEAPIEKQVGESILVEVLSSRDENINEEYADEHHRALIRIYTNKGDSRLTDLGNEVTRIFSNFVVGGFDRNILTNMDDVSQRQGSSGVQVRALELVRLSVYRGTPVTGTPPSYPDIRNASFITINSETAILPYSQQHINIQEANKHSPKIHDIGSDRHTFTQPVTLQGLFTVQNNAVITGNLTVQGTQTVLETTILQVKDPVVTLNKGETGAGITLGLGGIELDRGTLSYAQILFDETNDKFIMRYGDATRIPLDVLSLFIGDTDVNLHRSGAGNLHVIGGMDTRLRVEGSGTSAVASLEIYGTSGGAGYLQNYVGPFTIKNRAQDQDLNLGVNIGSNETTIISVQGSTGYVGVGTTTPNNLMEIRKDQAGLPTKLVINNCGTSQAGTAGRLSFYEDAAEVGYIERRRDDSGDMYLVSYTIKLATTGTTPKIEMEHDGNLNIITAGLKFGGVTVINSSRQIFPGGGSFYLSSAGLVANDKVLDSDKLDGYHVGNAASSVPVLDGTGQLILSGTSPNVRPANVNTGYCGTSVYYWQGGYFNDLRYKTIGLFDMIDDIQALKNIKANQRDPTKIDLSSLPLPVHNDEGFVDSGNMTGFIIGTIKKLLTRIEELEAKVYAK